MLHDALVCDVLLNSDSK